MQPREAFCVCVRVIGLAVCLISLSFLLAAVAMLLLQGLDSSAAQYLVSSVAYFVVGFYLLRGGNRVVHLAYGEPAD